MKKAFLVVSFIPLCLVEIYLSTIFLPLSWQHDINAAIAHLVPVKHDWTPVTHPMLQQEIELVLHQHIWLRAFLYLITSLLLAVNTWGIYRLVRFLRSERHALESD